MSAWKRNALRLFPERRREFTSAPDIQFVLASLENDFLHANNAEATDLGARICAYVRGAFRPAKHDEFERRVIEECLVHWCADERLRELVFKTISPETFLEEVKSFETRLEEDDFCATWAAYVAARLRGLWSSPDAG